MDRLRKFGATAGFAGLPFTPTSAIRSERKTRWRDANLLRDVAGRQTVGAGHHQRPKDCEARLVRKRAQPAYNGV
jgi:hypothetical protein